MQHYKSWSSLNKQLSENLCDKFKNRITYFLTRYHNVHNSYGRAAIRLDGKELVCFSWIEMYHQESDVSELHKTKSFGSYDEMHEEMKPIWDINCTYNEMDFLNVALQFRNMSIQDALSSDNYIIKILAILDKRVGKRTLANIENTKEYENYPDWVKQFFELRMSNK